MGMLFAKENSAFSPQSILSLSLPPSASGEDTWSQHELV